MTTCENTFIVARLERVRDVGWKGRPLSREVILANLFHTPSVVPQYRFALTLIHLGDYVFSNVIFVLFAEHFAARLKLPS